MVVGKATISTSSRASSSRLPPAPMTLGTSTRFLLVATRAPDRRMQSHSGYAYYKPSPWTSSKSTSTQSGHRVRQDPRGSQASRPAARAADEYLKIARVLGPYNSAQRARHRRRGDRMMGWMAPLRHLSAKLLSDRISSEWEPSMGEVITIGLDLAKHVFQVHGVDAEGATVLRKQLRRAQVLAFFGRLPPCLVGLEACATAHYWGRELRALGHEVRLMPAQYVKAYIKRNKHDAADAEAICEAVGRPTMRFVPIKTADQQAAVLLHRGRERLVRQRTGLVNALRGHLAEFGVIAPQGLRNVGKLIAIVRDEGDARLPDLARQVLQVLAAQIEQLEAAVAAIEKQLMAWHKSNPVSQRLASVAGIGPIIATALAATVVEPSGFRSGREFAAWLGLVPRQNSTGGKHRLGGISKRGNPYLRPDQRGQR